MLSWLDAWGDITESQWEVPTESIVEPMVGLSKEHMLILVSGRLFKEEHSCISVNKTKDNGYNFTLNKTCGFCAEPRVDVSVNDIVKSMTDNLTRLAPWSKNIIMFYNLYKNTFDTDKVLTDLLLLKYYPAYKNETTIVLEGVTHLTKQAVITLILSDYPLTWQLPTNNEQAKLVVYNSNRKRRALSEDSPEQQAKRAR